VRRWREIGGPRDQSLKPVELVGKLRSWKPDRRWEEKAADYDAVYRRFDITAVAILTIAGQSPQRFDGLDRSRENGDAFQPF
jgi:hypothetical protein